MIIDIHSHDFPSCIAIKAMAKMCSMTEGRLWATGDGTLENHLDNLELAGVDRAVMCPIATKPNQFEVIFERAKAIMEGGLGERAKRMIIPFASVHPSDPELENHLHKIAEAGIKGVKFHPYYQDFAIADKCHRWMFEQIAELGLVVQCHSGGDIGWRNQIGKCGPLEIEALMKHVRGLKFIAAHLGGCFGYPAHTVDRLMECGVYIDTSILHSEWHKDEPMRILRSWPKERILFGTDFPWVKYSEAIRWVKSVREPADWATLFGGNACRLLSI